jgi:hypothetical protein
VKASPADTFKYLYAGLEVTYTIMSGLKASLGARMPVYSWSEKPLQNPDKKAVFFEAWAGAVWTLPSR